MARINVDMTETIIFGGGHTPIEGRPEQVWHCHNYDTAVERHSP